MAPIHDYFNETQIVWGDFDFAACKDFVVSEVWHDKVCAASAITLHRRVGNQFVMNWLHQTDGSNSSLEGQKNKKCVLRIVWIQHDTKLRLDSIDRVTFQKLCLEFDHQHAQTYLRTQYAGIGSIDNPTSGETFFLCNHPKLAVTWSRNLESKVVSVICTGDSFKLEVLQNLIERQFIQEMAHWDTLPALMCSILSSKEVDIEAGDVKRIVRQVEARTGYHEWSNIFEGPARGDLVSLSAKVTGGGSRAASNTRKLGIIADFCQFIRKRMRAGRDIIGLDGVAPMVEIIEQRTAMQTLDLKYVQYRVQAQKEALFNLISTNDSVNARDIAENSRAVAVATNSDARSMKVLAVLTMTFLPGTFVSGLFSTPIIEHTTPGANTGFKIWKVGLFLYIALSFTLVLLTFMTWTVWKMKNKTDKGSVRSMIYNQVPSSTETWILALKRSGSLDGKTEVSSSDSRFE